MRGGTHDDPLGLLRDALGYVWNALSHVLQHVEQIKWL